MYNVKNFALKEELKELGVSSINELDEAGLYKLTTSILKINPVWEPIVAPNKMPTKINKVLTRKLIEDAFTFSEYMGSEYWDIEHRIIAEENKLSETLASNQTGDETYEAYETLGFGFFRLKPGRDKDINVSERWINEYFLNKPAVTSGKIVITNLETNKVLDPKEKLNNAIENIVETTKENLIKTASGVTDNLEDVSFKDLQGLAKPFMTQGESIIGKTAEELKEIIRNKRNNGTNN